MKRLETAYFGCGCFWTKEYLFSQLHGVHATRTGYMGGWTVDPTYQEVCSKTTGHAEVVEVVFDTTKTRFRHLLKAFFSFHDATRDRKDNGGQYRSVVFCRKAKHRIVSERAIDLLRNNGLDVRTEVESAAVFWPAEDRHQNYIRRQNNPGTKSHHPTLKEVSLLDAAKLSSEQAPKV